MDKRPQVCIDNECECLYHDHTQTFCVGQIPECVDTLDGKEHRNDYQFCIITALRGWEKHRFNRCDLSIVAKAMMAGLATCTKEINLNWYIEKEFHVNDKVVIIDDV